MSPNIPIPVSSSRNSQSWRRPSWHRWLPFLVGSALAVAMQTAAFAQVATNMVNFYADCGQSPMVGPGAAGSANDTWNPVSGGFFYSVATDTTSNQTVVDVQGNPVNDNFSITCGGGLFWPGLFGADSSGPATANLFCSCFLDFLGTSISVSITGLATNANYIMYTYGIGDSAATGGTLTWVDGTGKTITATADNAEYTPDNFVQNQNYTVVTGQSDANGNINFTLSDVANPTWNGTQLVPVPPAPVISVEPQSTTNSVGSLAQFNVGAFGNGLAYQWSFGTTPLTNTSDGHVTGATNATLTINNVSSTDVGSYSVTVTDVPGRVGREHAGNPDHFNQTALDGRSSQLASIQARRSWVLLETCGMSLIIIGGPPL